MQWSFRGKTCQKTWKKRSSFPTLPTQSSTKSSTCHPGLPGGLNTATSRPMPRLRFSVCTSVNTTVSNGRPRDMPPGTFRNLSWRFTHCRWLTADDHPSICRSIYSFYPIISYSILSYSILFYPILSYCILFYPIAFYSTLFYPVLSYPIYPSTFCITLDYWPLRINTWNSGYSYPLVN